MPRKLACLIVICLMSGLWISYPQPVFAQDIGGTPGPGGATSEGADPSPSDTSIIEGITEPSEDEVLTGVLDIKGSVLSRWDLSFSYEDNPTQAWFLLSQSDQPVVDGIFASWDTNSISDGDYVLRLRIFSENELREIFVNTKVDNQNFDTTTNLPPSPTITKTASAAAIPASIGTPQITELLPSTVLPSKLPVLRPNPGILYPGDILASLAKGVFGVVIIFSVAAIASLLKQKQPR